MGLEDRLYVIRTPLWRVRLRLSRVLLVSLVTGRIGGRPRQTVNVLATYRTAMRMVAVQREAARRTQAAG
jgi:hypothetical protein